MKTKLLIAAVALFTLSQCTSSGEMREKRVNACSILCGKNPGIKSMSFEEGGGSLFIMGGGYQKETCNCVR